MPLLHATAHAQAHGLAAHNFQEQHFDIECLSPEFLGTWIKDEKRSDDMSGVADVMGLSTIMRKAIKLIKGIEIRKKANTIVVGVFSVVTWFKLSERYNMDGSISVCSRRDFRLGGHRGRLVAHDANRLSMYFTWDNPYAGEGSDDLILVSPDELHMVSTVTAKKTGTFTYTTIYRKDRTP